MRKNTEQAPRREREGKKSAGAEPAKDDAGAEVQPQAKPERVRTYRGSVV